MKKNVIPYKPYLKEIARKLRKNMTLSEILLWQEIKNKKMKGYIFKRQVPIDNYIVDFYCKQLHLVIEIDGDCHNSDEAIKKDNIRQKRLESLGLQFLRFDDLEVKKEINNVLQAISIWILEKKNL